MCREESYRSLIAICFQHISTEIVAVIFFMYICTWASCIDKRCEVLHHTPSPQENTTPQQITSPLLVPLLPKQASQAPFQETRLLHLALPALKVLAGHQIGDVVVVVVRLALFAALFLLHALVALG